MQLCVLQGHGGQCNVSCRVMGKVSATICPDDCGKGQCNYGSQFLKIVCGSRWEAVQLCPEDCVWFKVGGSATVS